ncbi:hypothetical protein FACS189485_02300 [Spirochaetia bacterium]|nr:hypothetical protein FACS189485_02300 [Spirochaetia bacterium]
MFDLEKMDIKYYKNGMIYFFEGEDNLKKFLEEEGLENIQCKYEKLSNLIKPGMTKNEFLTWWQKKIEEMEKQQAKERAERLEGDIFIQDVLSRLRQRKIDKAEARGEIDRECKGDIYSHGPLFLQRDYTRENEFLDLINAEPDTAGIEKKDGGTDESILSVGKPRPEEDLFNKSYFYGFQTHLPTLKKGEYITETPTGLVWNDKKGGNLMLAAYFGMLQNRKFERSKNEWSIVEKVFNTKHLSQSWSDLESVRKGKSNKWDKEYKYLKNLIKSLGSKSL